MIADTHADLRAAIAGPTTDNLEPHATIGGPP
jgi:hypothetical protein